MTSGAWPPTAGGLLRRRLLDGEAGQGDRAPVLAAHDDFPAPAALTPAGVGSAVADIWEQEPEVEPEPPAEAPAPAEEQLQLASEPEEEGDGEDEEDTSGATFTPRIGGGRGADPAWGATGAGHRRPRLRLGAARGAQAADPLGQPRPNVRTPPGRSARRAPWWRRSGTSACRRR